MISVSVIIPVFNQWALTRQCLIALAQSLTPESEVIVVDNASVDDTVTACAPTGEALFGSRFLYVRHSINRNFAGACNSGALAARGQWLVFLNNDTLVTAQWLEPLLEAFGDDAHLGAAGPLLLYPEKILGAARVQHLGVVFGPTMQVSHLYEFFPASHAVVHKQRRLQAITAATLVMNKSLFLLIGAFDEAFVNGFEDVDLCIRLKAQGFACTCVPKAVVYHLCGQTPGRNAHEVHNSRLLTEKCLPLVCSDKFEWVREDGFQLSVSPWLTIDLVPGEAETRSLHTLSNADLSEERLQRVLLEHPLWIAGYARLATVYEQSHRFEEALQTWILASHFMASPKTLLPLWKLATAQGLASLSAELYAKLQGLYMDRDARIRRLHGLRKRFRGQFEDLVQQVDLLLAKEGDFYEHAYAAFVKAMAVGGGES